MANQLAYHRAPNQDPTAVKSANETAAPLTGESQLLANPVFLRALFGAVLDPTVAIDDRGTILFASASVQHLFGWTPDELVGRNVKVLMPEPHHGRHDEYLSNYRRTGVTHILGRTREFEVVRKNGERLVCELSIARAELPGAGALFIGAFRDVTAQREVQAALQESERKFRAIFNSAYQFIGLLQPDGTLIEVNRTALDAVGASLERVLGAKFWDTPWWSSSEGSRARLKTAVREAAGGEFVRFETALTDGAGDTLTIDFSLSPIRDEDGRVVTIVAEGRNISELKRAQRAEVAMLRALATIGESAAVLAHEIKNPITAVNLALRAVATHLGEDEQSVLADLVSRMQRLELLVRRTLSFAKPLDLRISVVDLSQLFDGVVRELGPEIARQGASVVVDVDRGSTVRADQQFLHEVMVNLIKNALEAQLQGAHIRLTARREHGGGTLLSVEDDGPGVAPAQRATLFKPFSTGKPQGTGLGLAFCRKVMEQHGGSIELADSPLGGTRFEARLPAPEGTR
jgi:PAS domain S-box-containing protein